MRHLFLKRSTSLALLVAVSVLLLALLAACGGGDNSGPTSTPGPVGCDVFTNQAFRYEVHVRQEVEAAPTPAPGQPESRGAYKLIEDIEGSFDEQGQFDVTITTDAGFTPVTYQAISRMDSGYLNFGSGWEVVDASKREIPLGYRPNDICNAISPDIDTSNLGVGQPEKVNGVESHKYSITDLPTQFFTREVDFGAGSDAGNNIKTLTGTIWVADSGNYINKIDVVGAGQFPSGQPIRVTITFESSDVGGDVKVSAPI